jgi:hypothetical protein
VSNRIRYYINGLRYGLTFGLCVYIFFHAHWSVCAAIVLLSVGAELQSHLYEMLDRKLEALKKAAR